VPAINIGDYLSYISLTYFLSPDFGGKTGNPLKYVLQIAQNNHEIPKNPLIKFSKVLAGKESKQICTSNE